MQKQMVLQLILLLTAVMLTAAAPKNEETQSKLQILSLSQQKLRALYHTSADEGIELLSEITNEFKYLSLTTFDGTQLVSARSSLIHVAILWKIMGYTIFLYNGTASIQDSYGMTEYVAPPTTTDHLEKEMKRNHITPKLLRLLDTENIAETKRSAFTELLSRPELNVIIELSEALGEAGVVGYENPAALNFHGMALNFAKMRDRPEVISPTPQPPEQGGELGSGDSPPQVFIPRRLNKREICSRPGRSEYYCNRCPEIQDCVGMCGRRCSCWSWVCGDCCYHQGCYDHDICCDIYGYGNYRCFSPFGFTCNQYRC